MMLLTIIFLSAWLGNITTSFFYRLPRNIPIHRTNNPPMCSNCGNNLKFYEYMPLFYRLFCGSKSRCCNTPIPDVYLFMELSVIISSVIIYLIYGLNNISICLLLSTPIMMCIIFTFYLHNSIPKDLIWAQLTALLCYKLYALQSDLFDIVFLFSLFIFLFLMMEKICNNFLRSDIRIVLSLNMVFVFRDSSTIFYVLCNYILYFIVIKKILNKKQSNILLLSMIIMWYPMILFYF